MIEKGGHGATTAAPATRMIYDALFNIDSGEFSGNVATRRLTWSTGARYLRHLDYLLLLATAGLIVYGVTMIYFATRHDIDGAPFYYVRQQLIAVAVGLVVGDRRLGARLRALPPLPVAAVRARRAHRRRGAAARRERQRRDPLDRPRRHALPAVGGGGAAAGAQHRGLPLRPHGAAGVQAHHGHRARAGGRAGVLRLPGAGLRVGHGHRGARAGDALLLRHAVDALRGARGDGPHGVRRRAQGAAHGRRPSHPAVPDRPALRLRQSRRRTRRGPGTTSSSR